mgnify:CR=1 FL=1
MPSRIQLSSVAESSFKKTGSDVLSEKHSLPTATNTAPIFHTMHSNREVEACLDEIAAIGKSEHWFSINQGLSYFPTLGWALAALAKFWRDPFTERRSL